jgi:O-antigen/teichoic acid export membrane protein
MIRLPEFWQRLRAERSFHADATLTAVTNLALAAMGFCTGIIAARMLGPHGRGELAAIQAWPLFIATLSVLGMSEAVVYYSARDEPAAGRYLGSAILVASMSSVPFSVVGYVLMPLMLHAQTSTIVLAGRWYLLIVPINALAGMPLHTLRGRSDFALWNLMRLMPNALWVGVLMLAWLVSRATPTFVAAANLVALALLIIPFNALVTRRVPGPFAPDPQKLPSMLSYGLPCVMTGVPQILNLRLDQMLMAALLPPRDLGLYAVAVAWSSVAAPLLNAVAAVTTPAVASAGDQAHGAWRMAAAARGTAALAFMLCLTVAVLTPFAILVLFGEHFRECIPAALVLVPGAGILGLNLVLQEGLRGMGRPYAALQAELAGLFVTGAALATMLQPMGIMGAAISSLLGYSTVTAMLLGYASHHARMPLNELLIPRLSEIRFIFARLASSMRASEGLAKGPLS